MTEEIKMNVLRPFGPSVARTTMPTELVNNLNDRDVNIKNHLACIKSVLEDKRIKNDATKIKKIKQILKNG